MTPMMPCSPRIVTLPCALEKARHSRCMKIRLLCDWERSTWLSIDERTFTNGQTF
jgi:hypothetical protein